MTDAGSSGSGRVDPQCGRKVISFCYRFKYVDGHENVFRFTIDYETLDLIQPETSDYPNWTHLSFHQCPDCPLDEAEHQYCPAAMSLKPLIESFRSFRSFEEADVFVETDHRTYSNHTSLQKAVSSLYGLLMAASGCPILGMFKPMVETHLPFQSHEETTYRMVSMYLTSQYFRYKKGLSTDWDLEDLLTFLKKVEKVNRSFCQRLHAIKEIGGDVSINAIDLLNTLGLMTSFSLNADLMDRMGVIFKEYMV